jgi:hypothetical protein
VSLARFCSPGIGCGPRHRLKIRSHRRPGSNLSKLCGLKWRQKKYYKKLKTLFVKMTMWHFCQTINA